MKYNVGLVSVSFRKNSPEEILEAMKRAELDWIEWGSDIHAPKGDPATLKYLASLQKKFGIACSSYGSYFRLGTTPLEELPSYLDAAERLGTDTVRLWCGDRDWEAYDEEEKKKLFQSCRAAGEMAEKRGITLCMECHNKTFTNCQQGASELMKTIHQESFRMYWQPNQHRSYEENLSYGQRNSEWSEWTKRLREEVLKDRLDPDKHRGPL